LANYSLSYLLIFYITIRDKLGVAERIVSDTPKVVVQITLF